MICVTFSITNRNITLFTVRYRESLLYSNFNLKSKRQRKHFNVSTVKNVRHKRRGYVPYDYDKQLYIVNSSEWINFSIKILSSSYKSFEFRKCTVQKIIYLKHRNKLTSSIFLISIFICYLLLKTEKFCVMTFSLKLF